MPQYRGPGSQRRGRYARRGKPREDFRLSALPARRDTGGEAGLDERVVQTHGQSGELPGNLLCPAHGVGAAMRAQWRDDLLDEIDFAVRGGLDRAEVARVQAVLGEGGHSTGDR